VLPQSRRNQRIWLAQAATDMGYPMRKQHDVDLAVTQDLYGHASGRTTLRYVGITEEEQNAVCMLSVRSGARHSKDVADGNAKVCSAAARDAGATVGKAALQATNPPTVVVTPAIHLEGSAPSVLSRR
jgi:hypothetical protein